MEGDKEDTNGYTRFEGHARMDPQHKETQARSRFCVLQEEETDSANVMEEEEATQEKVMQEATMESTGGSRVVQVEVRYAFERVQDKENFLEDNTRG